MTTYDKLLATPEGRFAFCVELGITNVTELLCDHLEKSGMTRTALAKGMGVTPGRVTQLLDGNANLTLASVARALAVFGHVLQVSSAPIELPSEIGEWEYHKDRAASISALNRASPPPSR